MRKSGFLSMVTSEKLFTNTGRAEKAENVNKGERKTVNKPPESDQPKQKKMIQLNLKSALPLVRNLVVSDKYPRKKTGQAVAIKPQGMTQILLWLFRIIWRK